ncbi:hypothetical protein COCNU_11G011610 [Cocos nucifera]|uniref:NAD(P)-binding domain-containing protein n=1 Tax=Cocos nucifera TaxID=13894 RepID=A0A8K0IRM8_COCNU|nr:hypothetical protein COCNU_11G011610 [Cocos nucifera]
MFGLVMSLMLFIKRIYMAIVILIIKLFRNRSEMRYKWELISGRSSIHESWADKVVWHQGNLLVPDSLKDVMNGVTAVISCVGGFGSNSHMYKINGTANINAIRAASEQGVKRFVYISAADFGLVNYLLQGYHEGKISCVGGFGSNSHMYKINGTANINAIRAASEQGVKRFVYISAADFGLVNYLLQGYHEGKDLATAGVTKRPTCCVLVLTKPTKGELAQEVQEKLQADFDQVVAEVKELTSSLF